jgi:hypothetical protein
VFAIQNKEQEQNLSYQQMKKYLKAITMIVLVGALLQSSAFGQQQQQEPPGKAGSTKKAENVKTVIISSAAFYQVGEGRWELVSDKFSNLGDYPRRGWSEVGRDETSIYLQHKTARKVVQIMVGRGSLYTNNYNKSAEGPPLPKEAFTYISASRGYANVGYNSRKVDFVDKQETGETPSSLVMAGCDCFDEQWQKGDTPSGFIKRIAQKTN